MASIQRFSNGMTLYTCPMQHTGSICLLMSLRGGVAQEPLSKNGITHLTEHLCLRRAAGMDQAELYEKIERTGGFLRAITCRERVIFEMTVAPQHFETMLSIFRALFERNDWTHADVRKEKSVVIHQIERGGNWTYKRLVYDFFEGKPQGEFLSGTKKKVQRLTLAQLEEWKNILFAPQRVSLFLTGEFGEREKRRLEVCFSEIEGVDAAPLREIRPPHFLMRSEKSDRCFTEEGDWMNLAFSVDVDPSKIPMPVCRVLYSSWFEGLLSPFLMRLREELGLIDEFDSDTELFSFGGILYAIMETKQEQAISLLREFGALLQEQKRCPDRCAFDCSFAAMTDGAHTLCRTPQDFAYVMERTGLLSPEEYQRFYRNVSYDDAKRAARQLLRPENLILHLDDVFPDRALVRELQKERKKIRRMLED